MFSDTDTFLYRTYMYKNVVTMEGWQVAVSLSTDQTWNPLSQVKNNVLEEARHSYFIRGAKNPL